MFTLGSIQIDIHEILFHFSFFTFLQSKYLRKSGVSISFKATIQPPPPHICLKNKIRAQKNIVWLNLILLWVLMNQTEIVENQ